MKHVGLFLLCLLPGLIWANDLYQIEFVVFEQPQQTAIEQAPTYVDEYEYYTKARQGHPLEYVSPRKHQLGQTVYALKKGNYRLIQHAAWQQALPLGERSSLLRIIAGHPLLIREQQSGHEFDGVMTFKQMRGYIHTTIDCLFQQESHQETIFRLKQSARLKPNEVEYFDHPRFGIMVKVIPVDEHS